MCAFMIYENVYINMCVCVCVGVCVCVHVCVEHEVFKHCGQFEDTWCWWTDFQTPDAGCLAHSLNRLCGSQVETCQVVHRRLLFCWVVRLCVQPVTRSKWWDVSGIHVVKVQQKEKDNWPNCSFFVLINCPSVSSPLLKESGKKVAALIVGTC